MREYLIAHSVRRAADDLDRAIDGAVIQVIGAKDEAKAKKIVWCKKRLQDAIYDMEVYEKNKAAGTL